MGSQFSAEEQSLDLFGPFGIFHGLAYFLEQYVVLGSERPQHMGLNQVPEREYGGLLLRRMDQRFEVAEPVRLRIGATDHPRPQGWHGQLQITCSLRQSVGGLISRVEIRGIPPSSHKPHYPASRIFF